MSVVAGLASAISFALAGTASAVSNVRVTNTDANPVPITFAGVPVVEA
jgi:hypothetical protein